MSKTTVRSLRARGDDASSRLSFMRVDGSYGNVQTAVLRGHARSNDDALFSFLPIAKLHAGAMAVLVNEDDASCFQRRANGINRPGVKALTSLEASDGVRRDLRELGQISDAKIKRRTRHSALNRCHRIFATLWRSYLDQLAINRHTVATLPQNSKVAERGRRNLPAPGLTTTCSSGEPAMAHRTHSTSMPAGRSGGVAATASPTGFVYRPHYMRRAMAHLATGSAPPRPVLSDLRGFLAHALTACLGILAGVTR